MERYVPSDKTVADIFTENLSIWKFQTFRTVLMGTVSKV